MKNLLMITVLLIVLLIITMACGNSVTDNISGSTEITEINPSEVVPNGDRILQIDVNEGSDGDYDAALQIAMDAGVEAVSMSLGWDDIETAPGEFKPETNWLEIANAYYPVQDIAVSLVISPIDTNVDRRPVDLRGKPFDDPEMINRYNTLLDYIYEQTPDLQLVSLSIGNEINATLGGDAEAWQEYTHFFAVTSEHARSLWTDVPIGSKVMYGGAMEHKEYVTSLMDYADILMVTYYPLDEKYQVQDPAEVEADLNRLAAAFPNLPIHLAEVGYPSSETNGSSPEKQAAFVHHIFNVWDEYAEQIKLISFTFQTELSPEHVSDLEEYYDYSNKAFAEYLRSLGMRTFDGQDKPAWQQLIAETEGRGW